jgi:hypothetical protein
MGVLGFSEGIGKYFIEPVLPLRLLGFCQIDVTIGLLHLRELQDLSVRGVHRSVDVFGNLQPKFAQVRAGCLVDVHGEQALGQVLGQVQCRGHWAGSYRT